MAVLDVDLDKGDGDLEGLWAHRHRLHIELADHTMGDALVLGAELCHLADCVRLARAGLAVREERAVVAGADLLDDWLPNRPRDRLIVVAFVGDPLKVVDLLVAGFAPARRFDGDPPKARVDIHVVAALPTPFTERPHTDAHFDEAADVALAHLAEGLAAGLDAAEVLLDEHGRFVDVHLWHVI